MGRPKESTLIPLQNTQAEKFSLPITIGIFHLVKDNKTVNEFWQKYQT